MRAGRARQASVSRRGAQGARGVQASGRGPMRRRAGARGAQAGRRQRARQAQAWARGALGVGARGARRGHAAWAFGARGLGAQPGCAAWACLCAQAGRAGWSAGLVLVHSASGSVLTQFSVPFDSVFS